MYKNARKDWFLSSQRDGAPVNQVSRVLYRIEQEDSFIGKRRTQCRNGRIEVWRSKDMHTAQRAKRV